MRRLVWVSAMAALALGGCDSDKGVGASAADVVPGAGGHATVGDGTAAGADAADTGGAPDAGAVADSGGADAAGPADTAGGTDATGLDDAVGDTGSDQDTTAQDTGGPVDTSAPDTSGPDDAGAQDTGGPNDAGPQDTGGPTDTVTPQDTGGPQDTGTPDPVSLIITEVMFEPVAAPDTTGEWIELYNTGTAPVNLTGLTIADAKTAVVLSSPAPALVAPGAYIVLGLSTNPANNGGAPVGLVYEGFGLTNTGDSVILKQGDVEIDRVDYAPGTTSPKATGASLQLDVGTYGSADPADWCLATVAFGAGDLGTPGDPNTSCDDPAPVGDPTKLVITEILYDPAVVSDAAGEWVEFFNSGSTAVDLRGLTFADALASKSIDGPSPLLVPALGRALIGRSTDPTKNGGLTVLWAFDFGLNNDKDSVILSKAGVEIDRVDYDVAAGWPAASGASIQLDGALDPAQASNGVASSWCVATAASTTGDLGTPGAANTVCGGGGSGDCDGACGGQSPAGCWCDAECVANGDCCTDACDTCGSCGSVGSCVGLCGGESEGCFCDETCVGFGDCCADACAVCGHCP